jgi:uncharacterized protein (TIGR00375 family)
MSIIADLHLHSKYSRAVSQKMDLDGIADWADKKGIDLVATGDWTHPLWFREIKRLLIEIAPGIYELKRHRAKFMLTTEISSIYTQGGKSRRIHNLIMSPSIATCEKVIAKLEKEGCNLMSDGRPIIGISSKDLLSILLEIDPNIILIPCHIWTPWFSLFGSKSGFDSVEESFAELSDYIYGVETGLSSDPIMNWQIKNLERRSILSFSDAHSGAKLGREATVFVVRNPNEDEAGSFSYQDIADAIKQKPGGKLKIGYTIEFFPEEGKYHWSGHRLCNVRYNPQEVKDKGVVCPVCHKPLTIGVENRVIDLSQKIIKENDLLFVKNSSGVTFVIDKEKKRRPFVSIVPLMEALVEINRSPTKAAAEYDRLTGVFASEFDILLKRSYEDIARAGGEKLKQAVQTIRERKVFVDPGYDGVFGQVKIFPDNQTPSNDEEIAVEGKNQPSLF